MVKSAKKDNTFAIHGQTDDGATHVVGIGNLRVVITNDDGAWFAQGLEIDYAAEGDTLEAAKNNFADGLYATIQTHLKLHGSIKKLLRPAPQDAWQELLACKLIRQRFTHVGIHELACIDEIEYFQPAEAA